MIRKPRFKIGQKVFLVTPDPEHDIYGVERQATIVGMGLNGDKLVYYFEEPTAPMEQPEEWIFATFTELVRAVREWMTEPEEEDKPY